MSTQKPRQRNTPILLATGNQAKQQKLAWLVEDLGLCPVTPEQLGLLGIPEEEGDTHHSIARFKAQEWSKAGSTLAIASDGGLVLPVLGEQWESLYTHRFAGPAADDEERGRRLLQLMQPYQGPDREASWVEALAIAYRGRVLASWELRGSKGVIAESPDHSAGVPGFWAFSLWFFPQYGRTYNRLTAAELESLEDHWTRLRQLVRRFFRSHYVPPIS